MRIRRLLATALAAVVGGTLAVVAVPQPAAADDFALVKVSFLWVRCQHETGEWGADEIVIEVGTTSPDHQAAYLPDFHVPKTKYAHPGFPGYEPDQTIEGDSVWVWVWERDNPENRSSWDLQGLFEVRRDWANTGERESYAFYDGQYIVRYEVIGV